MGLVRAAAVALAVALLAPSGAQARRSYYVALGDSVPVWNGPQSYPNLIARHYRPGHPGLRLRNFAVSGETTTTMLQGAQYPRALRFLRAHSGRIALITIDIGGNDIIACVGPGGPSGPNSPCATQTRARIMANIRAMLRGFARAAPHTPVIGMTYFNPYLGHWLAGGFYRQLALSTMPGLIALNKDLTRAYGGASRTADVEGSFHATDLKTYVRSKWGRIPIAVERACSLLTITCYVDAPEAFGDDPNDRGAAVIARAFQRRINRLCVRRHAAFRRC
jgi:lysophospholipase L1-like esterase